MTLTVIESKLITSCGINWLIAPKFFFFNNDGNNLLFKIKNGKDCVICLCSEKSFIASNTHWWNALLYTMRKDDIHFKNIKDLSLIKKICWVHHGIVLFIPSKNLNAHFEPSLSDSGHFEAVDARKTDLVRHYIVD